MYGRARCKVCGKLVAAEVEKNIQCPNCGRVFRIPNSPRYTAGANNVNPHRSVPPITSTGLTRGLRVSTLDRHIRSPSRQEDDWQVPVQIVSRKRKGATQRPKIPLFPEQGEPDVIEEKDGVWVIVEFPRHKNIEEIQWRRQGNKLVLKSAILSCPYQNEILLPEGAKKPFKVQFLNGILEMQFEK